MVKVTKLGVVLEPTSNSFESRAVLNPAVYQEEGDIHIIYRAVDQEYISCLGYAKLVGPTEVAARWNKPFLYPKAKVECKGIEDPRIVKIGDTIYMTYVVHDGKNAISAFAYGKNIFKLRRGFVISPKVPYKDAGKIFTYSKLKDEYYFFESFYQRYCGRGVLIWHKDCILFPEKINNEFMMLHRILPDIQIITFADFAMLKDKYFWIGYLMKLAEHVILEGLHGFESRHLGGGAPPIKTEHGWLVIYHSAQELNKKRIYYGGAAMLDLNNPRKVIARLPYPILSPTERYEVEGAVNDVVFPTGTAILASDLYIYYGAADKCIAVAKVNLEELISELLNYPCPTGLIK